jgi:hypothetical protein
MQVGAILLHSLRDLADQTKPPRSAHRSKRAITLFFLFVKPTNQPTTHPIFKCARPCLGHFDTQDTHTHSQSFGSPNPSSGQHLGAGREEDGGEERAEQLRVGRGHAKGLARLECKGQEEALCTIDR